MFVTSTVSPVIAYTNPYLDVVEGSDVDLSCVVVQGNPTPTIHWQKGAKVNTLENSFDELDTYEWSIIKSLLLYPYMYLDYHFSWINLKDSIVPFIQFVFNNVDSFIFVGIGEQRSCDH